MLRSLKDLQYYNVQAKDGEIGKVDSFLFDDLSWNTRYLVADIGSWLTEKYVLISPFIIDEANSEDNDIHIRSTKDEIRDSMNIEDRPPVFMQKEKENKEEQHIILLPQSTLTGVNVPPYHIRVKENDDEFGLKQKEYGHLRSTKEVIGYKIQAIDGEIGTVEDFIVDSKLTWSIYFIVIDTDGWLVDRKVLVSPKWITGINWNKKEVKVDLIKNKIENSPIYDPEKPIDREYESLLFEYYSKPKYWV